MLKARHIKDQRFGNGEIPCCTSAALCTGVEVRIDSAAELSMMFHYFFVDKPVRFLRDAIESAAQYGFCRQTLYPYDAHPDSEFMPPSASAHLDGQERCITGYRTVGNDLAQWRSALADGKPIVIAFALDSGAYRRIPIDNNRHPLISHRSGSRHAAVVLGYSDADRVFVLQDCQGDGWADHGCWYLPYTLARQADFVTEAYSLEQAGDY